MTQLTPTSPPVTKKVKRTNLRVVVKPHDTIHAKVYFEEISQSGKAKHVSIPPGYQLYCTDMNPMEPAGRVKGMYFPMSYSLPYKMVNSIGQTVLVVSPSQNII